MKEFDQKLKSLLSIGHEPVIGIRGSNIAIANPAAVKAFGLELEGRPAEPLIPSYVFEEDMESFVASAKIAGRSTTVSVSHFEDLTLLAIKIEDEDVHRALMLPYSFTSSIRSAVFNLKMAADKVISLSENREDENVKKYSSILYHNYYSMLRLTGNLSTAADLQEGSQAFNPAAVDMVSLCSELVSTVRHLTFAEKAINIKFESVEGNVLAVVDKPLIERLLLQLFANSFLNTPVGGEIKLSLKKTGKRLTLAVDDTGCGIAPEVMSSIFTRFEYTPTLEELANGAGLGLNVAKGIAELHGGALIIESRENIGTHVRVMLPTDLDVPSKFNDAKAEYNTSGMSTVLVELSGVLSHKCYNQKYMD